MTGGECERCGASTDETTLAGVYRCPDCQDLLRDQDQTRAVEQAALGTWGDE